jgi:hypothetical protein
MRALGKEGGRYHNSVPTISSWVAAQKRNTQALFENYILTIPQLVLILDFVVAKGLQILELGWTVRQDWRKRDIAIVQPWCNCG